MAGLLNRFLGMYVRNFDPGQLKVGIWSGDVKLRDLELRREALDQLKLPINVVEGHLGQLTLTIPWSNLRGQPVKVFIEDVYLLAAPKEDAEYDEDEEERRRQAVKIEKLDSAEMLKERNQEGLSQEEQKKSQSFTDSLVSTIVNNLQISVKNIHIRYEDSISAPGHPFALGATLKEFSAISTDGDWKPTYIQNSTGVAHKLGTLDALAVYWNTDSTLFGSGREAEMDTENGMTHQEMLAKFKEMIVKGEDPDSIGHQFILKPVSGKAKIEMDKSGKIDIPKLKAGLLFDEIGLVLDDDQYRDALMMVDLFHYFMRHQEYKKFQPKGVSPKEDPRAWLKFAGDAVLNKIHERNRRWSWAYFKERRDDRIRYIELFKKKKSEQTMTSSETEDLEKLEWKLTYEDLRFWRSLARNQLKKENVGVRKPAPKQQQGWIAWAWGSKPKEEEQEETTEITEEDRKKLYDAIDYDEKTAIAESVDLPRETVKLQINADLKVGSFTLKRDIHNKATEVLSLYFDSFKAKVLQRPDSFLADVSLGGLRVNDGTTANSLYPQIVRVKDSEPQGEKHLLKDGEDADPFFQLQFEQNPLDESADLAVTAKLKSMEVIYNPNFVVEIVKFFKPPERHMDSIYALMDTAGATVESIRQQTRAGLEFALEEHKTINAKLDLQAPLIIVPMDIEARRSPCLILDAGHASVNSELVDKATMQDIQAKQKQTYTDEDYKRLEGLMFDKFLLDLEDTQVLIGPSMDETKAKLDDKNDKLLHIVDRINVRFVVEISIVPKAPNVPKMRVSGNLPVLHASVSDQKYKSLMSIINVAIPKFSEEDETEEASSPVKRTEAPTKEVVKKHTRGKESMSKRRQSRPQSTSFQFSALQQAIILEDSDNDDEDDADFEDAPNGQTDADLKLGQKNFELSFSIDKLQGSLYRSDPEGQKPDKLLVELVAEKFHVGVAVRPFDLSADVSLQSVVLDDHVEDDPQPEFKHLVSSGETETDEKALIQVKYAKINRKSPEFQTVYAGIETNLDVAISTINLIVTRRTLLTLLDFILITFTNPEAAPPPPQHVDDSAYESDDEAVAPAAKPSQTNDPEKIRVQISLKKISMVLNNDGIRLATLSLIAADLGIFLMGKTMRIGAKLGDLSLLDDIDQGAPKEMRELVSIEGKELADFTYETFDADDADAYPGYDSSVGLQAGSLKVNFSSEPFRKVIDFLVKFGRMQALFNAARQAAANQAQQVQQSPSKMHFDITIKTPIIVFPRTMVDGNPRRDTITAYLGEIYAQNKFVPLDDSKNSPIAMRLSAGIRNIKLVSAFYFDNKPEELEMIHQVDLGFAITNAEHQRGAKRPDTEIVGNMTDFKLRITQAQLKFLIELSKSVPSAFAADPDSEAAEQEVPKDVALRAQLQAPPKKTDSAEDKLVSLQPELKLDENTWNKLDLVFKVHTIGLELLLAKENEPVGDLNAASLSKFSLDDTTVKLRMISDGSLESELTIHSFTIQDSRTRETNKFRKIMTSLKPDAQQFMASVTISGGAERNLIAMVAIDSPRIIFALDYLFAIRDFVMAGLTVDEPPVSEQLATINEEEEEDSDANSVLSTAAINPNAKKQAQTPVDTEENKAEASSMSIAFRANIVDAQIILIANPLSASSEAIVLGTKQVLMAQQHALTLQVSEMGMFLCRMDRFEDSRLRILDDFSLMMSMDTSQEELSSLHLDIEPLVLRVSLRDILLANQIVSRASALSDSENKGESKPRPSDEKAKQLQKAGSLKRRTGSGKAASTVAKITKKPGTVNTSQLKKQTETVSATAAPKHEELTATLEGMRVILIGDLHELPILDLSIKNFTVNANDWSSNLSANTQIDMFMNIYNFSKSTWEPLIEPWQLGFNVRKAQHPACLTVELESKKMMELTITSATIALASKANEFLSQSDDVLSKPRGADAPYRIRNYTGFDINVWADMPGADDDDENLAARLADGEEAPWRFEDWAKMREHLNTAEAKTGIVGVRLEGSGFDSISKIAVNREGEYLYSLRPRKDQVLHRLLVEVSLGTDNVKCITFRSPLLVENNTQIPVEIGVFDVEDGHLLKIEKVAPGEARPAPVGAAFMKSLLIRPDQGFGYGWSDEHLWWKDLLKRPTRTITCKGDSGDKTPPFYFQMNASYDKTNPLTRLVRCIDLDYRC